MKKLVKLSFACAMAFGIVSCSDDKPDVVDPAVVLQNTKAAYVKNYVDIVQASYDDSMSKLNDLNSAVKVFVANPTQARLDATKQAWLNCREPYGQTEVYRFYDGPIDGNDGEPEGYINAWPLDEGLIDYTVEGTSKNTSNLIGDASFKITKQSLIGKTGVGGEENVTIGYHAIEFLLWGQDNTTPSAKKPGQRPLTDFTTDTNAERRKLYLKVATEILVDNLKSVVDQWRSNGTYRASFLALPKDEAINKILTGAAKLSKGELAGERIAVAVENQNQEDEHSCFSDNTHRDIFLNAKGIHNIITGSYKRIDGSIVSGTSLIEVLTLINATKAGALTNAATEAMQKVKVISDNAYFDNQIIGETLDNFNKPVMAAVLSLRKQGDQIAQAGQIITKKTIDPSIE